MKREQKQTNAETQSFIIHESTIRMSSLLSDEELGRLIRYFYMYSGSGQAPEDEPNLAVTIIFNEWRLRYELDKKQYETVRQKRSEAGSKGVAKRWGKTKAADDKQNIAKDNNAIKTIAKIADSDSDSDNIKENSPEGESKKKISLPPPTAVETRKKQFYQSIIPYTEKYDREMLNDFFQYWTELDKHRRRMRFEMQKTWETGKRLATWERKQFGPAHHPQVFLSRDLSKTH